MNKLQHLLITHLKENGTVTLTLPDGIQLEIGITQINNKGDLVIDDDDDYCWVTAKKQDKSISLDSFNLGLSFADDPLTIVFEDVSTDDYGRAMKTLEVI